MELAGFSAWVQAAGPAMPARRFNAVSSEETVA
jgi:hypothetical protein